MRKGGRQSTNQVPGISLGLGLTKGARQVRGFDIRSKIVYFALEYDKPGLPMQLNLRIRRAKSGPSRLVFLIFLLLMLGLYLALNLLPKTTRNQESLSLTGPERAAFKLPPLQRYSLRIPAGTSLSDLLEERDFSAAQIHRLREDVKPVYDLARIKAGQEMRIFSFQDGAFVAFEYDIDRTRYLQVEKHELSYRAEIKQRPLESRLRLIWGVIEDFPISALARLGESALLAIMLEEIFAWDVDFRTEIQPGDSFKILVEKEYIDGVFSGYGDILAAEFINQGRAFHAFRFTYPDSQKSDYFTLQGNSVRKEFLKSPLKSPRITSRFTSRRLHPVWKTYRPHYGVDYGAPVGTPVYATADGVVTFAGWSGASGRMIRIRHNKGYETMYLHLRRFASGVKRGTRVKMNQLIAQVGASGTVNGPHLDYRIRHYGKYINPLAARFDPVEPLRAEFSEDFQDLASYYRLAFDAPWLVFSALSRTGLAPPRIEISD
jgi:murein DD-endopeptidase MepM/ murein hydrolase activator NlpD